MALLALEKAPFFAIFPLPIQGAGQTGCRADNRGPTGGAMALAVAG